MESHMEYLIQLVIQSINMASKERIKFFSIIDFWTKIINSNKTTNESRLKKIRNIILTLTLLQGANIRDRF